MKLQADSSFALSLTSREIGRPRPEARVELLLSIIKTYSVASLFIHFSQERLAC